MDPATTRFDDTESDHRVQHVSRVSFFALSIPSWTAGASWFSKELQMSSPNTCEKRVSTTRHHSTNLRVSQRERGHVSWCGVQTMLNVYELSKQRA